MHVIVSVCKHVTVLDEVFLYISGTTDSYSVLLVGIVNNIYENTVFSLSLCSMYCT